MRLSKLKKLHQNLLDIALHLVLALTISFFIYFRTGNAEHAMIFFSAGVLIDIDHFLDYFLLIKGRFQLMMFLDSSYCKHGRVYLLFHSWELIIGFFILSEILKSPGLLLFSLGLFIHLAVDNLQRKNLLSYFFLYRRSKDFNPKILFPECS